MGCNNSITFTLLIGPFSNKKRINGYKSDIALIEKELISNDVLIDNIDDSKNYFESIINTIESQNITDSQLKHEINRMKRLAKELNISISQLEIDLRILSLVNFG